MTGDAMDPFDAIKKGNPLPGDRLPSPDSESAQRVMALVRTKTRKTRIRRRRLKVIAWSAAALLALAAAAFLSRTVTQPNGVSCFVAPNLEADFFVVVPNEGLGDAETCASLWLDGTLSNPDVSAAGGVPDLLGCVSNEGRLLVFPSSDPGLCETLGLARVATSPNAHDDRVEVAMRLEQMFAGGECISLPEATSRIMELLSSMSGGDAWRIDTRPSAEGRPCASYNLDGETRTITIIPIPTSNPEG